jgi:DNA-directed RNA polymerase specialized sigma24 family protein
VDRKAVIGPWFCWTREADAEKAAIVLVSTDTELTRRTAAGDRDAFERLFAQCLPPIWTFASRRTSGRAAAEALTLRILRRAFLELEDYDGQVPFAAWLLTIARRVASTQAPRVARMIVPPPRTHLG